MLPQGVWTSSGICEYGFAGKHTKPIDLYGFGTMDTFLSTGLIISTGAGLTTSSPEARMMKMEKATETPKQADTQDGDLAFCVKRFVSTANPGGAACYIL